MCVTNNININTVDELLNICIRFGLPCPRTSRTLLHTHTIPRNISTVSNCLYHKFDFIKNHKTIYHYNEM